MLPKIKREWMIKFICGGCVSRPSEGSTAVVESTDSVGDRSWDDPELYRRFSIGDDAVCTSRSLRE